MRTDFLDQYADEPIFNTLQGYVVDLDGCLGGSLAMSEWIADGKPFVWHSKFGRLFRTPRYHNMVATCFWCLDQKVQYEEDRSEDFLQAGLGFWFSSVAQHQTILISKNQQLTAQEKRLFRRFRFEVMD